MQRIFPIYIGDRVEIDLDPGNITDLAFFHGFGTFGIVINVQKKHFISVKFPDGTIKHVLSKECRVIEDAEYFKRVLKEEL